MLGGSAAIVIGVFSTRLPADARLPGFVPIRVLGRPLGVVVASRFDDPPPEQPIAYAEVIVALLLRRGLRLAALPLTMRLDQRTPVDEGRLHYGLPKVYDPSLRVAMGQGGRDGALVATGKELHIEAQPLAAWAPLASLLAGRAFALGARAFTAVVPVYGVAYPPHRRAIVALRPAGPGRALRVGVMRIPGPRFRPLWGQAFARCTTWLGRPHDWSPGGGAELHAG